MAVQLRVRKAIKVEELRRLIGDARTEDILLAMHGPKLLGSGIVVKKEAYENTLAFLEGRLLTNQGSGQVIPLVFRRYFFEVPKARFRFETWLKKKVEEDTSQNGSDLSGLAAAAQQMVGDTHPPRQKRRVTKAAKKRRTAAHG